MRKARPQNLQLLLLPDSTRNNAATSAMEGRSPNHSHPHNREKNTGGQTRKHPSHQATEGHRSRRNDHGPTAVGRIRGVGFLRNSALAPNRVTNLICGASKREQEGPDTETMEPRKRRQTRPIIPMALHLNGKRHPVRTLLDTGCSIPVISQRTIEKLGIERKIHKNPRTIENFTGETVKNAGQYYTKPMQLQHRNHFTNEQFEVALMEEAIDLFLPFEWIERHPPQGSWTSEEMRFSSTRCVEQCTKFETNEFSLSWDDSVAEDPSAGFIGYVSEATTDADPLSLVPEKFHPYLAIMEKEAADALPEHRPYDCRINLKEGEAALWGPIYPLSEVELQTLREWLKEMEHTGKIRRSMSPAGSPILFVPKPNGRGLRLCVDYRALNRITVPN